MYAVEIGNAGQKTVAAIMIRAIQRGELRLENEIILIKGARKFGFDSLTEVLEKKVHETILEVNMKLLWNVMQQ